MSIPRRLQISLGILLSFSSLWIGSYILQLGDFNDWWLFPTTLTTAVFFGGGLAVIFYSLEGVK